MAATMTPRAQSAGTAAGSSGALKSAAAGSLSARGPSTSYERMVDSGLVRDAFPTVQSAGKSIVVYEDTTGRNLQPDLNFPIPSTPVSERKYRKNYNPGTITTHYGLVDQYLPPKDNAYGYKTEKGEDVAQNFKAGQIFGVAEYLNMRGESIYESTKKEPLGKSYVRGHRLAPKTVHPDFEGFGKKSGPVEDGKDVVFPRGIKPETEDNHAKYVKTHGNFAPGEMFVRKYQWPQQITQNPHFRFGICEQTIPGRKGNGAKSALTMDFEDDGSLPTTRVVQRTSEDYRHVANDHLAVGKNMMQGKPPLPSHHAHGIKCIGTDISAGEAIRGFYAKHEQASDKDLGKCTIEGKRNFTDEGGRAFGTPSVRTDLVAPHIHRRSVAATMNYGDEVGASALLRPQRFELQGVPDTEFLHRRPKEELKGIVLGAGYKFEDVDFNDICDKAAALFGDDLNMVSLDAFMYVYSEWINEKVRATQNAL